MGRAGSCPSEHRLTKAERKGTLRERIHFLCQPPLLVVDEIGCLPVIDGAAPCHSSSSTVDTRQLHESCQNGNASCCRRMGQKM